MNRRFFQQLPALALLLMVLVTACTSEEDVPKGQYENGVLVASQGQFQKGNGSLTFFNHDNDTLSQAIFKRKNGFFPGDVLQSMIKSDDNLFLVLNGSNKVIQADAYTMEEKQELTADAMDKPRHAAVADGKVYVTNWGAYTSNYGLKDSYVLVLDLATGKMEKQIDTPEGAEDIIASNGKLFVSEDFYGSYHGLTIIDPATGKWKKQINLSSGAAAMIKDEAGKIWVLCTGNYQAKDAMLYEVDPAKENLVDSVALDLNVMADVAYNFSAGDFYVVSGQSVYVVHAAQKSVEKLATVDALQTPSAIGYDKILKEVWVGDALDYTASGKVYRIGLDGSLKGSFKAGIVPTDFLVQ